MLFLLLVTPQADISEAEFHFQKANEFYQEGDFQKAIESYTAILDLGYESASLYYNLGNSYFKLNDIGHTILYYEKAKKLAPGDPDVRFNLELVQLYVVDKINAPPPLFFVKYWNRFTRLFNRDQLALVSVVMYVLGIICLILMLLLRKNHILRVTRILIWPIWLVFLFSVGLFFIRTIQAKEKQGVVIVDKVDVLSSPSADATTVFSLHEGIKLQILEKSGDYVKISLPDGKVGWLGQDIVERI
jgi:tetratricopeptide (TPR) repeat protein